MAFAYFNRNIPDEAHQKIGEMGPAGVRVFAFTPSGGWVLVTETGYFARNIPDECFQKLGEFIAQGHKVRCIAFPPAGGNRWIIVTDKGYFARNIADECYAKLGEMWNAGARPSCIAFPPAGGNRWVILAGRSLYARGIPDECFQLLCNYAQGLRPAERVAFTPGGGWTILAKDRFWARNIPDECYQQMGKFSTDGLLVDHVVFEPTDGWSIISNTAKPRYASDKIRTFEERAFKVGSDWQSIWERMAAHNTPGVSIAVVLDNQVAWACTYGKVQKTGSDYVHTDTVFQAASCSKPVSALGFLRLVQARKLTLTENVNPKLGFTLPRRACTQAAWLDKVTLRRMLRHEGGIIGRGATTPMNQCSNFDSGGGGFGGYANTAGVGVPNLGEVLAGVSARAGVVVNSPRVELTYEPGTMSAYAGHAFVLMMKLLETQFGQPFDAWMKSNILDVAGMSHSTFDLDAPSFSGPPAAGHKSTGTMIAGKRNRYPEGAAAGLYTTASDLCRFVILLNQDGAIDGKTVLSTTLAQSMKTNQLGIFTGNTAGTPQYFFTHNGANAGFRCILKGYPERKAGFAILTNGDDGDTLYGELTAALIAAYGWES